MKMKKKGFSLVILSFLLILSLSACFSPPRVEYISNWSFQYNEGTADYSLFFALEDSNKKQIAAEANVDIRIVNKADEVLYEKTLKVFKEDFDSYTSEARGDAYLANVRIPKKDIKKGKSLDGTVFFRVYKENAFKFDECNCPALYILPIEDFSIKAEKLPQTIGVKAYGGSIQSKILIERLDVEISDSAMPTVTIVISGKKTYDNSSVSIGIDTFDYQLVDSQGYTVKNGTVYLNGLGLGDKFKDETISFYDLVPGEKYVIRFLPSKY